MIDKKLKNMDYHWTASNRRSFLEALASTGSVTGAANEVGMSARAAYTLRTRGIAGFRLAWDAAILLARAVVEGMLMDRAIHGEEVTTIRDPETHTTRRIGNDRRLGLHLLTRLDKKCDALGEDGKLSDAQIVADDFDAFLDLISTDADPGAVSTFIATRRTDKQCELRQETKLFEKPVWQTMNGQQWRTAFPPPPGFDGDEYGDFGEANYRRDMTEAEIDAQMARNFQHGARLRDAWFGFVPTNDNGVEAREALGG
jgi:hypothetical protein